MTQLALPSDELLSHMVDAHCHPTDNPPSEASMGALKIKVCAMASRKDDQAKVYDLAERWPDKVIPCFGWHPWHSHTISLVDPPLPKRKHYSEILLSENKSDKLVTALDDLLVNLPDPMPLSTIIAELRSNLMRFPNALLGEVGIDRSFRVPFVPYPASSPKKLSPFTVPTLHQLTILEAQIEVAVELRRPISMHSVKAQQITLDLLKRMKEKHKEKWGDICMDMHSCGFSAETWLEVERLYPNIFLSLSIAINARSPTHEALIRACSPERILAESDYTEIDRCAEATWEMIRTIADIKNWHLETTIWGEDENEGEWGVIRRLEGNFQRFIVGGIGLAKPKQNHRQRQTSKWDDEGSDEEYQGA